MIRAKFQVESLTLYQYDNGEVKFRAITDNSTEENIRFTKYTPSGTLTMVVTNPAVLKQLNPGKVFYVDFTETTL